jgi:hypothetical protein
MFFASASLIGEEGAWAEISSRNFRRTRGLVTRYRSVTRIAVAVVSEPARLVMLEHLRVYIYWCKFDS